MTTYEDVYNAICQMRVGIEQNEKTEFANGIAQLLHPIINAQERQAKAQEDIAFELNQQTNLMTVMVQR